MNEQDRSLHKVSPLFTVDILKQIFRTATGCNDAAVTDFMFDEDFSSVGLLSSAYRINVRGVSSDRKTEHSTSFIVKGLPPSICARKSFKSSTFFKNEVLFYNEVLPKLLQIQENRATSDDHLWTEFPKCYKAVCDGENDFIVLEDLTRGDFGGLHSENGLTFEQCVLVLKTIGKFHALSFAMKHFDPSGFSEIVQILKETYYTIENKEWYWGFHRKLIQISLEAVREVEGDGIYLKKFSQLTDERLYDRIVEFVRPRELYSVIAHADAWPPNFLFRNDIANGVARDVRMIDFQLSCHSPAVRDVISFIYTSTHKQVRDSYFETFLQTYHQSLGAALKDLGCSVEDVFPYNVFKKELAASGHFAVGTALSNLYLTSNNNVDMCELQKEIDDLLAGEDELPLEKFWVVSPYKSEKGKQRVCHVLTHAVDNGYL